MTLDVMVDLETLGTGINSVFVSLGAVVFDPQGTTIPLTAQTTFYRNVNIQSALDLGLQIDGDTVYWWLKQSDEARRALSDPAPASIAAVMSAFAQWFGKVSERGTHIWSHGATFDIPMIAESYRRLGTKAPWFYSNANDTRTIFRLANLKLPAADHREGGHNSVRDAIAQAEHLQRCMAVLGGRQFPAAGKVKASEPEPTDQVEELEF